MDWLLFLVQWLHVIAAITWLGGTLFLNFVIIPTLLTIPPTTAAEFNKRFTPNAARFIEPAAYAVIVLGLVRGTFYGPVKSLSFAFTTSYGITFTLAFIVTIATFVWGKYSVQAGGARLGVMAAAGGVKPDGTTTPEYAAELNRVRLAGVIELLGFAVIFTCMILMRFGM